MKNKVKVLIIIAIGLIGLNINEVKAFDPNNATGKVVIDHNITKVYFDDDIVTSISVYNCGTKTEDKEECDANGKNCKKTSTTTTDCTKSDGKAPTTYEVKRVGEGVMCPFGEEGEFLINSHCYDKVNDFINGEDGKSGICEGKYCQTSNSRTPYYDNKFYVDDIPAYCIDPGYAMSTNGIPMQCHKIDEYTYSKAMKYIINSDKEHLVKQIALRFVAGSIGKYGRLNTKQGQYVKNAYKNSGKGLVNEKGRSSQIVTDARNLANEAWNRYVANSGGKDNSYNKINLVQTKAEDIEEGKKYRITFSVTTTEQESIENANFTCSNCVIEKGSNFSGTSGELVVRIDGEPDKCDYRIDVSYKSKNDDDGEFYVCKGDEGYQQLVVNVKGEINIPGVDNSGPRSSQNWIFEIPNNSEYYKKYCPNRGCPNGEGTTINIPTYCDFDKENKMEIHGPSNIQQCVLKSKDEAGNSYQDTTAVDANNPYCSVYCKEDYDMTLPTAKYKNNGNSSSAVPYADSGRYFELTNSIIQGTRTCYISSAANKSGTDGIDVTQYKKDVTDAQKALIDAYNSFAEAKTYCENNGGEYTQYQANCDDASGECTFTSKQVSATLKNSDLIKNTCDEKLDELSKRVDDANKNLENITENINKCYNWSTNFCFDPEAIFDYADDYTIDYDRVTKIETDSGNMKAATSVDPVTYKINDDLITQKVSYASCTENGCDLDGFQPKINLSTPYLSQKTIKTVKYNNSQRYEIKSPSGTLTATELEKCVEDGQCLEEYFYLGAVFPIALKNPQGVYNWSIDFNQIGQMNLSTSNGCSTDEITNKQSQNWKDNNLGRLNKVAEAIFEKQGLKNSGLSAALKYQCIYVLDCPECEVRCVCGEDPDAPTGGHSWTCEEETVEGEYTEEGAKISSKCVYTQPESKCDDCEVYCVNCIFNGNDTYSYRMISVNDMDPNGREDNGTLGANWANAKGQKTKYEIESNPETGGERVYQTPEYSFTITPTQMKKIRDYNKEKRTYIAQDVNYKTLDGYTGAINESDFIRDTSGKYFSNKKDEYKINDTWTLWNMDGVTLDANSSVGPAWK